jgi:putative ABC transport system ATP-binding protein
LEGVCKHYRQGGQTIKALDDVSLKIDHGEFVAIVGPSGSGKSTFLNLVGCLDRPTAGSYWLDGHYVHELQPAALDRIRNEKIGFIFQRFELLARTTAAENVELPLLYAGARHRDHAVLIARALEAVGLSDRVDHWPNQLSGGEQQRVAIARALVNDPAILLADEPTGALDSTTTREIMVMLEEINQRGVTLILVTHDGDIASRAQRVVSFADGRVVGDCPV